MATEIKIELNSTQKRELRKLYANYKSLKVDESTTREEVKQAKDEYQAEFTEKFPDLAKLGSLGMLDEELIYSKKQLKFIQDAEDEGLEVDYTYSGRGMYGDYCPAVRCDSHNDLTTKAKTRIDSMGRGIVIYAEY